MPNVCRNDFLVCVAAGLMPQRAFGSRTDGFSSRNGCFGSRSSWSQTDFASILLVATDCAKILSEASCEFSPKQDDSAHI